MFKQMVCILTTIIWRIKETNLGIIKAIIITKPPFSNLSKEMIDIGREKKKRREGEE